jgi:PAS domain S-box-containing protein
MAQDGEDTVIPQTEGEESSGGFLGRQQYQTFMAVLPHPAFATDQSGYLQFVNAAFTNQFGREATPGDDELHLSDFISDDDIDAVIDILQEMLMSQDGGTDQRTIEVEGMTRKDRTRTFEATFASLSRDGEFAGVAAVFRDISTRKRRGEVFTVMDRALRHNLRTNVNIINGYTEHLEQELADDYQEMLTRIQESVEWIHKLGTSLRTLQKTISESFASDETVNVENIVEAAVASARKSSPERDVSIHISAPEMLEAGRPVEYAIENIVENAIVHNDSDSPSVDVWVAHAPQDGWIDIHVEANGPGFPELEREFVLGDASVDQLQHGGGLGLWITRWVVEIFDGELEIEDNDPRGSVVTIRLPITTASEPA